MNYYHIAFKKDGKTVATGYADEEYLAEFVSTRKDELNANEAEVTATTEEVVDLAEKLEKVERDIWWLDMADRFRPDEEAQWDRLWAEKKRLEEQIRRLS